MNCIENYNKNDLLDILPTLYHDLVNNSTETLLEYELTTRTLNIQEQDSKLRQKTLANFCLAAPTENKKTRANVIFELCIDELEGLPTNYYRVERDFSKLDC